MSIKSSRLKAQSVVKSLALAEAHRFLFEKKEISPKCFPFFFFFKKK